GKILFVIYDDNKEGVYGNNHQDLINSFSPCDYKEYTYLTELDTTNDYNSNYRNRIDTGNYLLVAEFYVTQEGTWQFAIDSDDGSEVEIDGTVVASYYGAHGFCWCKSYSGSINLTHGWHRIIVRLRENHGDDGVLVWYKKPGDASWKRFSASTLTIRAPSIDNTCRLKSKDFILSGEPASGGGVISCKRHLFCITSLGDGQPHRIRVLLNRTNRVWEWASKERPVCDNSLGTPDEEYFVRVKVCDPSVGLEEDCKQYPAGNYKPTGLLQKYGEGKGGKFCSKSLKPCSNDGDCGVNDGVCIKQASLYFGLITGSYTKNLSGGVLRKRIWNLNDEIDSDTGIFKTTIADKGSIIQTINRLRTVGFRYSDHSYQGSYTCGWITTRPLHEGECRMWGNPIGEMMYEAERYFAGKKSPTPDFTYSDPNDTGLNLPKPDWNDPYAIFPWCSKP
ncbi:MAG: pilus assembly protein PilY, partial [Deltaproteobacteria bacterium]